MWAKIFWIFVCRIFQFKWFNFAWSKKQQEKTNLIAAYEAYPVEGKLTILISNISIKRKEDSIFAYY